MSMIELLFTVVYMITLHIMYNVHTLYLCIALYLHRLKGLLMVYGYGKLLFYFTDSHSHLLQLLRHLTQITIQCHCINLWVPVPHTSQHSFKHEHLSILIWLGINKK